jgi:hypothetical protein
MARETGLEPAASAVTGRRSNQLSYSRNPHPARKTRRKSEASKYVVARPKSSERGGEFISAETVARLSQATRNRRFSEPQHGQQQPFDKPHCVMPEAGAS